MSLPIRVLVAHDSPSFRDASSTALASVGYEVLKARDRAEALELLMESLPDVIISNLHMDGIPGYKFMAMAYLRFPNNPVIAISSSFKRDEFSSGILADGFVHKEVFTIDQLSLKIIELIAASPIGPQSAEGKVASVWVSRNAEGSLSILCARCQRSFKQSAVGLNGGMHNTKCPSCDANVQFQIDRRTEGLLNGAAWSGGENTSSESHLQPTRPK